MMTSKYFKTIAVLLITITAFVIGIILASKMFNKPNNGNTNNSYYNQVTDTIISKSKLKQLSGYKDETKPKTVIIYKPEVIKIDTAYLQGDTICIKTEKGNIIKYQSNFLTNFSDASKLIDMKLSGSNLSLSLLTPKGQSLTQLFKIDPFHYNYIYTGNKLTLEPNKKWYNNFTIYGQLTILPLVNIYSTDVGINYKTSIIIIDGGVKFYFIPEFEKSFNLSPYIGIRYNLPWPGKQ
mgnify:CR=1 FL=1